MALLLNNCKKLSLCSMQLLRSSSAASQIIARHSSYESKMFPGYNVIYCLDSIRSVCMINRLKRNSTIIAGVALPASYGLEAMSYLPFEIAATFMLSAFSLSVFFHSVGYFCNNVVGFIYAKKNTDDIVISYVGYWGIRMNVQTTISDVDYIETKNYVVTSLFNTLKLPAKKLSLRIYSKGTIIDEGEFYRLLGI
ncbi:hypothetical protein PV327_002581 [Microctonus hyperodae]|uniref:Transmembrane protein 186 n=1 Tax=Microctonus hyperodae TaxID=165561 RepID=A0AA39FGA8_MICHY|nr:hypothetical protein PV327_002581 [Microctonus hyperodae]